MANEYHYCVSLSIVHPTINPKTISAIITDLTPNIEIMAGSIRVKKDGSPFVPERRAAFSHWLSDLHPEDKIFSEDITLSDFLLTQLIKLEIYKEFLTELKQVGEVIFSVGWYSNSNYSAGCLTSAVLKRCGDLGIDLELNYYTIL